MSAYFFGTETDPNISSFFNIYMFFSDGYFSAAKRLKKTYDTELQDNGKEIRI